MPRASRLWNSLPQAFSPKSSKGISSSLDLISFLLCLRKDYGTLRIYVPSLGLISLKSNKFQVQLERVLAITYLVGH